MLKPDSILSSLTVDVGFNHLSDFLQGWKSAWVRKSPTQENEAQTTQQEEGDQQSRKT